MNTILRAENLVKRFRSVDALSGFSVDVQENSIYALVGPNGAGKTTAIKVLMNIMRPTSGRAQVLGKDSATLAGEAFAQIGYISENQDLPDYMSVHSLLSYLRPFYPTWDKELEARLIRNFRLPMDRKLSGLSRGMRMKVALPPPLPIGQSSLFSMSHSPDLTRSCAMS